MNPFPNAGSAFLIMQKLKLEDPLPGCVVMRTSEARHFFFCAISVSSANESPSPSSIEFILLPFRRCDFDGNRKTKATRPARPLFFDELALDVKSVSERVRGDKGFSLVAGWLF